MKTRRNAGFELLRIICMMGVVSLHYLNGTNAIVGIDREMTSVRIVGTVLESLSIFAVNAFVIMSGYFLLHASFRVKKVCMLMCQIWFYALLIPCLLLPTGVVELPQSGIYHILNYLFPIQSEHYWFMSFYIILYLLTPVLNPGIRQMKKNQLQALIVVLLVIFSIVKSIIPATLGWDHYGYSLEWFVILYLTGAYIRMYGMQMEPAKKRRCGILLYGVCAALICVVAIASCYAYKQTGIDSFGYYVTAVFHYNHVLCYIGAIGVFYLFAGISVQNRYFKKLVMSIAPYALGVYLLHTQIDTFPRWIEWLTSVLGASSQYQIGSFLGHFIASVCIIFVIGIAIDWVRAQIFDYILRVIKPTKLIQCLKIIDRDWEKS